jgi:triosephosphate isomerase
VQRKVASALANELAPILCVGETLEEREEGRTEEVVRRQVEMGTRGLSRDTSASLVVAYEPVWAIGTGRAATGEEANRVSGLIRTWLTDLVGAAAASTRILYGGSMNLANAPEFIDQDEVDGGLVGGASLDPDVFAGIVKAAVPKM